MRRALATTYCIASLLAWFVYGPFFHSHSPAEGGALHAHFDVEEEGEEASNGPAFDHAVHGHDGFETSIYSGNLVSPTVVFAEIGEAFRLVEPIALEGVLVSDPVGGHDPPLQVPSSPRAPPA